MTTLAIELDATVEKAQKKYSDIAQRRQDVREQIETLQQSIADGDERLVGLRAEQILNGRADDERYESLTAKLGNDRETLRTLETEQKALAIAEREAGKAVQAAQARAKRQAADRLYAKMQQAARELDEILTKAEQVNDELIQLDAEAKAEGVAEAGGKALLLVSRGGAHWSALNRHHTGQTITLLGWRQHVRSLLEVE
jgi:DNA repair exonuclease SbcCD ATPase subunit